MAKQLLTSVWKSMELLKAFSADRPELSLAELSGVLHLHKSSVFRMLATLEAGGFVEKDRAGGRYRLGLALLDLAGRVTGRFHLRSLAGPLMEGLAAEIGEIVHLSVLDGADIVYLEKKGQGHGLTVATRVGGRNPAYASAMGKVMLAGLPAEELQQLLGKSPLRRWTTHTITETPKLLEELERTRRRGYGLDNEEIFPGIRCVAAPVCSADGKVIAAISATVPKHRMGEERTRVIRRRIVKTAQAISERVCGIGGGSDVEV